MSSRLVSIISVTWNGKRFVHECLRSLKRDEDIPLEVIIVDNASTDGTPDLVAEQFPEFKLICNRQNYGFAKANNIGIQASQGRYLCLVNSDVVVPEGCFRELVRFMDEHTDIGILGPQMIGPDGDIRRSTMRLPSLRNSLLRAFALDGVPWLSRAAGGQMMSDFRHNNIADVEILNGWFWVIRREALDQVGLLDERFFMYGEDMDWCHRFREAGWRVVFYPYAKALHYGGASSSAAPIRFYVEMQRANLQYWSKHYDKCTWLTECMIIFLHHVIRLFIYGAYSLLPSSRRRELVSKTRRSWALLKLMFLHGIQREHVL